MMVQQTRLDRPGSSRWWCLGLDCTVAPWLDAGMFPAHPTILEAERVFDDAMVQTAPTRRDGKDVVRPIIEIVGAEHRIDINNPSALMQIAASYVDLGMIIRQFPDREMVHPSVQRRLEPWQELGVPWHYALAYTLVAFWRPSGGVHWVLCDLRGERVLFDPDESLHLDGWRRDGRWRGVQITRRAA